MKFDDLTATPGSATKARKRIGRGHGAGTGKTAGKGQKARRPAAACVRALKAARCLCREGSPRGLQQHFAKDDRLH